MLSTRYLLVALAVLLLCTNPTTAARYALGVRQETTDASQSPTPSPTRPQTEEGSRPTETAATSSEESVRATDASATSDVSSVDTTAASSTGVDRSITSIPVAASGSRADVSPSVSNGAPSATSDNSTNVGIPLPIQPKVTPSVGIMGIFLLVSGLVYTIIGIRNRWLYISMSAAFLTSLAVTVLIIYVVNPPVSDAIQGAFFVAACVTGLILGGLALIFPEVTEGLGCLLGGFCLSMWFLSVREGSLIRSGTGRAIFIGVMSFAAFSLSFSRYTRTYGLIVCIAFAGATAMVLGIDCFSRAGLKEFWMYIWNINDDLFPLNTNTYPITRGIRVEIACTIVFFLFGLMSQFKIWKVIKERREKKEAERRERDDSLERLEEEVGRRVENNIERERAQWEAVYGGNKSVKSRAAGSSDDSVHKGSGSFKEARRHSSDSIELDDLGSIRDESRKGLMARENSKKNGPTRITVRVAQDDDIHEIDPEGNPIHRSAQGSSRNSIHQGSSSTSRRGSTDQARLDGAGNRVSVSPRTSHHGSAPPAPQIIPLPFKIPTSGGDDQEDTVSVSTIPETAAERPKSKRASAASALRHLSISRSPRELGESQEALIVPHVEDDAASSVAATFDEIDEDRISLPPLSRTATPGPDELAQDLLSPPSPQGRPRSVVCAGVSTLELPTRSAKSEGGSPVEASDAEIMKALSISRNEPSSADQNSTDASGERKSLTASTDPKANDKRKRLSLADRRRQSALSESKHEDAKSTSRTKSAKTGPASDISEEGVSQAELVKENLPGNPPKVVLSYRTNEWAKHLEAAEQPQYDEFEPSSPGIKVDLGYQEAAAMPLAYAHPAASNNPYRNSMGRRASGSAKTAYQDPNSGTATPTGPLSRDNSIAKLATRGLRTSSAPLLAEPLVESLTESYHSPPDILAPSPLPANTLLSRREGLLRAKPQSTSFMPYTTSTPHPYSSTPNVAVIAPSDSASVRGLSMAEEPDSDNISLSSRKQLLDGENMSLAERKALIQRQQAAQLQAQAQAQIAAQQQRRQGSWPLVDGQQPYQHVANTGAALRGSQAFNSHQPARRASGVDLRKQEAMLASWRSSLALDMVPPVPVVGDEGRRAAMLAEQRQRQIMALQEQSKREYRDGVFEGMMRRGDMLDAHREALRRMQAGAKVGE